MALAERWFGRAREIENFVCIGIRSGIGAGVVIDGKLHRGFDNLAGEIGGWPTRTAKNDPTGKSPDTLEHKASVTAILQQLTDATRSGAKTTLKLHANRNVTLEEMLCAARANDALVVKVLRQAATYVGRTISQMNLVLNPQQVIIAGPLAEFDSAFLQPIRETVERLTPQLHGRVPHIVASHVGEFSGALGAAALAVYNWRPAR
jgi:N-acetylglucosamine repressor